MRLSKQQAAEIALESALGRIKVVESVPAENRDGMEIDLTILAIASLVDYLERIGLTKEEVMNRLARLEGRSTQAEATASRSTTVAVEVLEDSQWRTTLHPSEAAAEWFISHTENETRRVGR